MVTGKDWPAKNMGATYREWKGFHKLLQYVDIRTQKSDVVVLFCYLK
jgi:hypothetical protein